MSASLVGSEMCIRDRGIPVAGVASHLPGGLRPADPPTSASGALARPSVSYTHLTLPTICSV
eukprot:11117287-Alexandrium_andersonii.AAC.1